MAVVLAAVIATATGLAAPPLRSVGLTVGDLGNPFFVQIAKGAEAKARALGGAGVRFTAMSSGYDLNQQMNQMEDFVAARVDLIVLGAADTKGIAPAVRKARKAGITVVAVDVAAEGGVDATVMSDNVQAGRLAAQYIVDRLKGRGRVVMINGPVVSAVTDRMAGASGVFTRHAGITVLSRDQNGEGSRMGGMNVMGNLLTAFPRVEAVFAINDPSALGAALELMQARRSGVFVVGVDGAPDAEKALADPESAFAATAAQDPFAMAAKAVEVGEAIRQGNAPAERTILIPVELVTRENRTHYRGWTIQ
jgi:ribose transport system substrate-binding protein